MPHPRRLAEFRHHFAEKTTFWAKRVTLPFLDGVPLYNVSVFFWRSIANGSLTTRASAIAYNFFLALFPLTILCVASASWHFRHTWLEMVMALSCFLILCGEWQSEQAGTAPGRFSHNSLLITFWCTCSILAWHFMQVPAILLAEMLEFGLVCGSTRWLPWQSLQVAVTIRPFLNKPIPCILSE